MKFLLRNWYILLLFFLSGYTSYYVVIYGYTWSGSTAPVVYCAATTVCYAALCWLLYRLRISSSFGRLAAFTAALDLYLIICFEFLEEMLASGDERNRSIPAWCIVIPAVAVFFQLIAACLLLFRKKWRARYADRKWKIILLVIYAALLLFAVIAMVFAAWFVLTFRLDIGPVYLGPRC